jgi:hypothetical protein
MRRRAAAILLTFCLVGCRSAADRVPLGIDDTVTAFGQSCILMHQVVDVAADPVTGALILDGGGSALAVKWPKGFTAWRAGSETEVVDTNGSVVLRTGARYSICPSEYLNGWVVGMVHPCPDCTLGFELD